MASSFLMMSSCASIQRKSGTSKKKHDAPDMADAILQRDLDKSIKLVEVSAGLVSEASLW